MKALARFLTLTAVVLALAGPAAADNIRERPEYRPSSDIIVDGLGKDGAGTPFGPGEGPHGGYGYLLDAPFQLNALYQSGVANSTVDLFNDYNYPGDLNFADAADRYFIAIDEDGGLPILAMEPWGNQILGPGSGEDWVQWTITGFFDASGAVTVLAGDFIGDADTLTGFLRVQPYLAQRAFPDDFAPLPGGSLVTSEVVGYWVNGFNPDGTVTLHAALVPEPSSLMLLGIGVLGLLACASRRRAARR